MKKQLLILSAILLGGISFAQQGDGGTPKGQKVSSNFKTMDSKTFVQPDIAALQAEDALVDGTGTAPWRFGFNNYTNLGLNNAGTWYDLPNGDKLWLLKVTCENALTVNLTFKETEITEGNELYVYNPDKSFILGKFSAYHTYEGVLGTELVPGNTAIVEYYVPQANANKIGNVTVGTVTHGYRTANEFMEKAFGSSGSCNMNVNCTDGAAWTDQRNGAVMLVSGSSGFCSGSLINNTLNDGKPYVLTANHCYSNPASWIFRFNWQSTGCANGSNPSFVSLSGAVLRSRRTPSDFCLVEITGGLVGGTVPASYSPYFSGWDNSGTIPTSTVSIHHPSGDIKKISFDDAAAGISQGMGSTEANSTWTVEWDRNTTTEGGSSGSPIFDQNHRIIGQLWGGGASCSNLSSPDYYGRVSNSWNPASSNSTNQLKFWLDPNNAGAQFIDGYDPSGASSVAIDAGLNNPQGVSGTFCGAVVSPQITISNGGTTTLTSATITYGVDGDYSNSFPWTGSLAQYQTAAVTLPNMTLPAGNHTFNAQVTSPNGSTDENANNNLITSALTIVVNGQTVTLSLDLDCYASETSWELRDASNTVLYSESGYSDGTQGIITRDFCLSYGCYSFKLMDSYGDGLTNCSAANGGNGSYNITYNSAIVAELLEADANFAFTNTKNFCIQDVTGLGEIDLSNAVSIYPNPANETVTVFANNLDVTKIELLNIAGQVISTVTETASTTKLNVSQIASGVYLVKTYTTEGTATKQLIIK
ncbi:MAG: T9SS type A sorting domain-containing protein [Crocinitomicaceae bacterium]|nr:T9SS type A sorting domain-containing protein [Crocinitomicaceae bacterium]MCF8432895.1 T9SS type A sorting domain-containing protein [Crocinitomicaceae bacterium]